MGTHYSDRDRAKMLLEGLAIEDRAQRLERATISVAALRGEGRTRARIRLLTLADAGHVAGAIHDEHLRHPPGERDGMDFPYVSVARAALRAVAEILLRDHVDGGALETTHQGINVL